MSALGYAPLITRFQSFAELQAFLKEPRGQVDKETPVIVGSEKISFSDIVAIVNKLAKKRWTGPESEIDASLDVIEKLRRSSENIEKTFSTNCFCLRTFPFRGLSDQLNEPERVLKQVKQIYDYVKTHLEAYSQWIQNAKMSLFVRPKYSGLCRAIHIDCRGRIVVHLNRKSKGDFCFPDGAEKKVRLALELGKPIVFITAGYKVVNLNEFECLKAFIGIPGFVQLVDYFKYMKVGKEKYRAIYEYCNGGDLFKPIIENSLSRTERKAIFIELVTNLALMHQMGYLHRDLKLENILLHRKGEGPLKPIIADFGSACRQDDVESRKKIHRITARAASPEYARALVSGKEDEFLKANTPSLDSWSLGCILNMLLGMQRYTWMVERGGDVFARLSKINGNWMSEPVKKNSPEHLVWEMLQNRLLATEAVEKLAGIDWSGY